MSVTLSAPKVNRYDLVWDTYWSYDGMPELGGIYSSNVRVYQLEDWQFEVSFRMGEGRTLGVLFCEVVSSQKGKFIGKLHYSFGQFYTNEGAIKFAKFALANFIETEKWDVCPSFCAVDYINGEPYTLTGDEIVSELI
jgi:hypothetical protein